jgi:preprotein translocase subunit SecG
MHSTLTTVLTILHVVVCTFLILTVLLQAGKGGGMGIAFGGGGSQTVFGSSGAGNFLTRLTAVCATIFFLNSLGLAYLSSQSDSKRLQTVSEKKARDKQAEQSASDKLKKDVEQARQAVEKATGVKTEAPAAPAAGTTEGEAPKPAEGAAPGEVAGEKAEKAEAKPAKAEKAEAKPAKPAAEPKPAPAPAP